MIHSWHRNYQNICNHQIFFARSKSRPNCCWFLKFKSRRHLKIHFTASLNLIMPKNFVKKIFVDYKYFGGSDVTNVSQASLRKFFSNSVDLMKNLQLLFQIWIGISMCIRTSFFPLSEFFRSSWMRKSTPIPATLMFFSLDQLMTKNQTDFFVVISMQN